MTAILSYEKLFTELSSLVESVEVMSREGRNDALLKLYWQVGKRVESAVSADPKIIARLSHDMNGKFGSGYSVRNLHYMRKFHRQFAVKSVSNELSWSHYRALLSLSSDEVRDELFARAVAEKLSNATLSKLVRLREGQSAPTLPRHNGPMRIVKVLAPPLGGIEKGKTLLDTGFETRIAVKTPGVSAPRESELLQVAADGTRFERIAMTERRYFFEGFVERVIDGDTIIVQLKLGFGIERRMRMRLKGVDAEPVETVDGQKAFALISRRLKPGAKVAVETFQMDPYGRYLGYVFYSSSNRDTDAESLLENGRFINQELLDSGLAIVR